ncbi:MAG TPA: DUF882 domain-containing protein [Dongiaceae bacterium]|nr:DUF882 domain-containing protein [Dongiaceae bacterium]
MPLDSQNQTSTANLLGRRRLLGLGAAAAATALIPARSWASLPPVPDRSLTFHNTHTNENLNATYWRNGTADHGALTDINHILRDFRTGEIFPIDVKLLDLLTDLHRRTGSKQPFQIISGYRSPKTNATLAAESSGVATRSLHMDGKAIDIRLADVPLRKLHDTAVAMKIGGVGMYPQSNFVHVDTGRVRYW